jgi:stage II sporulation protein Q
LAKEDGKEFEVAASLSGTVTKAEKDPLLGNVIEIEHKDGVTTVYQSLASMTVAAGDEVEQNEIIGQAGKSLIQEQDGVHVHFEIRKDGAAVNPLDFMDKPVTSLNDVNVEKEAEPVKEQPVKEEEGTEGEEKGAEEEKGTEQEKEDAEKGTEEDKEKEDAGKEGSEKGNSQDQSEASISTKNA